MVGLWHGIEGLVNPSIITNVYFFPFFSGCFLAVLPPETGEAMSYLDVLGVSNGNIHT